MKLYILLFSFIFTALTVSAQKSDCSDSQPRPISGNQHPCAGSIETYCIENDRNYTSFDWDVPRAHAGEPPVGWEIISGQGTNCVTVRVGQKNGTMKVKVTDPVCGTKVATLPVKPGESFEVTITGPQTVCTNEQQVYTASISEKQKGPKKAEFAYNWSIPADWTVVADGNPNDHMLTVIPGASSGTVSVFVEDTQNKQGKGNNGNGVGGKKAYCGTASDGIEVVAENCGGEQPEEPICVLVSEDDLFTFGYLGATQNSDNTTTVRFSIQNTTASPISFATIEVMDDTQPITAIAPDGFKAEVESGIITYQRVETESASGNETLEFGFTLPTETHQLLPAYTLSVFTEAGDAAFQVFNTETCDDTPIEALPVELSSFEGKATASGIELSWTTASETNNDRFEVQRSTDGKIYTTIGTVKGAGNSSTTLSYSFTDTKATNSLNYYRLQQVDLDGTTELSKVIAMAGNATKAAASMTLYPNPVTGNNVSIALNSTNISSTDTYIIVITDMNGRKVFEQQLTTAVSNEINLPLDQLRITKGLYMVKLQSNNLIETQKLLIK